MGNSAFAQTVIQCLGTTASSSSDPTNCGSACFGESAPANLLSLPVAEISVDFHFVEAGGQNFDCIPGSPYYAPLYAYQILAGANDRFSAPEQNQFGTSPQVPDARIRFKLVGDPFDPCEAMFFHQGSISGFNNPDAIHIIISGTATAGGGGTAVGSNQINLNGIHHQVFNLNNFDITPWAGILNHEFGHITDLCHAFYVDNLCPDIDPVGECGGIDANGNPSAFPLADGCGGNGNGLFGMYCEWNTGNNFMGENSSRWGMTMYQWAHMYQYLRNVMPVWVQFYAQPCETIAAHPPLEIPSNTTVEWNTFRIQNEHVEVRPGATLIISCEVQMGKDQPIIVNRGARLFVTGGKITSQDVNCRWAGILVHGNKNLDQPAALSAKDTQIPLNQSGAGVVWLNGATIENAANGVATKGSGGLGGDYFGGLVMAYSSDFINCGRAVEFMKYDRKNNSYFSLVEVKRGQSVPFGVTRGVSIWSCHGISFDETHFSGIDDYGISGYDFTANVTNCSVKQSMYAFKAENTMPNASIFQPTPSVIYKSKFYLNRKDVYINAAQNMVYGYTISENEFYNGTGTDIGVDIRGESSYFIGEENTVKAKTVGIRLRSTGGFLNKVKCNIFEDANSVGAVSVSYFNDGLEILGNNFVGTGAEIRLLGDALNRGEIQFSQGDGTQSAGNCFLNPVNPIGAAQNSTVQFDYYVYNLPNLPVGSCFRPTNNLSDGGTNNYRTREAAKRDDCTGGNPPGIENPTEGDLATAREIRATAKADWDADPNNWEKGAAFVAANKVVDQILRFLLDVAYKERDWEQVENLFSGEETNAARRQIIGLRTSLEDFAGARDLLDEMPILTADDSRFVEIMNVNFALRQSAGTFELSAAQEQTLKVIANTPESIMCGYACALLSMLKDYTCEDSLSESFGGGENQRIRISENDQIALYPNPTTGILTIQIEQGIGENIHFDLISATGKCIQTIDFINEGQKTIDLSSAPAGVFAVKLTRNGQVLSSRRLVILH